MYMISYEEQKKEEKQCSITPIYHVNGTSSERCMQGFAG